MSDLKRIKLSTGVELDVWDTGPRDAPAIIFLHGFPENHRTWRHQVEHLSDRFRCIAPDQRGYGNSSHPQDVSEYETGKLVADIFALSEALETGPFTIVGHDWGGAIAWLIAMFGQADGRVTCAVIANAPHPGVFQKLLFTDPDQRAASQYMRAFRDPANDPLVREHGLPGLLREALDWDDRPEYDPAEIGLLIPHWVNPDNAFAMLNWYRASAIVVPAPDDPLGLPDDFAPMPLPPLAIPTLVVWGMKDQALLPGNIEGLDAVVTDLTLVEVPEAGHFVPWEAPDAVNAAMDAFLG
ncbi:alpha/beta fold hydrolase [Aurantiacibacter gilvus]|uniref:Alpha/beta hydrolase n=1 Tax=Aurantiacibacter gilvus TaxID=3139141 RepID=A0ABU9IBH1_9SPHN